MRPKQSRKHAYKLSYVLPWEYDVYSALMSYPVDARNMAVRDHAMSLLDKHSSSPLVVKRVYFDFDDDQYAALNERLDGLPPYHQISLLGVSSRSLSFYGSILSRGMNLGGKSISAIDSVLSEF